MHVRLPAFVVKADRVGEILTSPSDLLAVFEPSPQSLKASRMLTLYSIVSIIPCWFRKALSSRFMPRHLLRLPHLHDLANAPLLLKHRSHLLHSRRRQLQQRGLPRRVLLMISYKRRPSSARYVRAYFVRKPRSAPPGHAADGWPHALLQEDHRVPRRDASPMAIDDDENGASPRYNLRHQGASEPDTSQAVSPTRMFIAMYLILQRSYLTNPSYSFIPK